MKQTKREKAILPPMIAAAVVLTAFIWGHSAVPATQSAGESMAVLPFFEPLLLWLGVPPAWCHAVLRKLAHFSEYGLLGVIWSCLLLAKGCTPRRSIHPAASVCLFTALIDETIQLFVPGRSGMVADIWIDFTGASVGILGSLFIYLLIRHFHKRTAVS